jgi:hypothetical protein
MVYFGGTVLRSYGLTLNEWLLVVPLAFLAVPVDMIRKAIIRKLSK